MSDDKDEPHVWPWQKPSASQAKPEVTHQSNSDMQSNDSGLKPSARLAENPSAELKKVSAELGASDLAKLAGLTRLTKAAGTGFIGIGGIPRNEQSKQSIEKPAAQASQSANPMHPRDRRFYLAVAFATVAAGFAFSCFIAGASKQLDWVWAICGIVIGLLLTVLAGLDALEKRVPFVRNTGLITIGVAAVTWLLIGWQSWLYIRAPAEGYTQAQLDTAVSQAKASLQAELNEATKQRDAKADELTSVRRDLANARQIASQAPTRDAQQPASPTSSGPIEWRFDGQLVVTSWGPSGPVINGLIFQGQSTIPLRFKEAYLISGMTGHKVELKANAGGYFPVTDVDVPADASVQLDVVFQPPLPVRDFFDQWGKFRIVIIYEDGTTLQRDFDENFVREKVRQMAPDSFGPHVTPRQTSK